MKKNNYKLPLLILIFVAAFFCSIIFGTQKLTFLQLKQAFTDFNSFSHTIIFSLRLPRSILAVISGALLASSGACFQLFFRNSLAEPGIIGISAASTLGAVISQCFIKISAFTGTIAFFFGAVSPINLAAFAGALISGFLITIIGGKSKSQNNMTILLCGTAFGTLYSSVSSIILLTKNRELHGIYTWILGSFNGRSWNEIKLILLPAIISVILMICASAKLDLLIGGEESAQSLGVDISKLRNLILISSSLAVSCSVCAGGTINFVGLISPHLVRKLYGEQNLNAKKLILISMFFGATIVTLSDTLARTLISPSELPAGIITSLLGAPFFISLIFKKGNNC